MGELLLGEGAKSRPQDFAVEAVLAPEMVVDSGLVHPCLANNGAEKCRRDSSRNGSRVRWEHSQLLAKHCVVPIRRIGFWHPEPQEKHCGQGDGCDAQKSRRATKVSGNKAC
jgi:hypothetical protein